MSEPFEEAPASSATAEEANDAQLLASDLEVEQFIAANCHDRSVTQREVVRSQVEEFVRHHVARDPQSRFAVVTSGGTVAPLELKEIRHITNLSTGQRAAISAEWFLRCGYKVIYFHKTGCLQPFARHFQSGTFLDAGSENVAAVVDGTTVRLSQQLHTAVVEHQAYVVSQRCMLKIPFHTVGDYQLGMKTILTSIKSTNDALRRSNATTLVYLVAAVSDFYIPYHELPKEKIDSNPNAPDMTIYLRKVPKALARGLVGRVWGAGAFVTTFKLETDETRIDEKVMRHINGFSNIRLVVSNLLDSIRTCVTLRDTRCPAEKVDIVKAEGRDLEADLVQSVIAKHTEFVEGRW